jgi:hypothetical protein
MPMQLVREYVGVCVQFSKIFLACHGGNGIVWTTCTRVVVRCIRSVFVLDPIEPSGIVKVASIVMPHSFAGVEDLE